MNTYQIHVDTASPGTVETYSGQVGQASVLKQNGNPFQATVILGNRHRAIRTASLKDAQIPVGFYNVRAPYNTMNVNSIVYTITPSNYTLDTLTKALNNAVTNAVGTFSSSSVTNQFSFASNSGTVTMNVQPLSLLSFLGFTNGQVGTSITGTNAYIINFDTYISIWIQNLGTSSLDGQQITYKVPVTGGSGSIIQYTESSNWEQKIVVTDRSNRLDRLIITVVDRFGNVINNNGLDWSMTLEIESDT
jgi:hypothetical protein